MFGREEVICLVFLDQEAPHLKFSSENDCFPLFKRECAFNAREIVVPLLL